MSMYIVKTSICAEIFLTTLSYQFYFLNTSHSDKWRYLFGTQILYFFYFIKNNFSFKVQGDQHDPMFHEMYRNITVTQLKRIKRVKG